MPQAVLPDVWRLSRDVHLGGWRRLATAGSSVAAGAASLAGNHNVLPPCVDQGTLGSASVEEPHFTLIASSACATDGPSSRSLDKAAAHLGMNAAALRKTLEGRAVRAADGATEAALDGVRARKFRPAVAGPVLQGVGAFVMRRTVLTSSHRGSARNGRKGSRS